MILKQPTVASNNRGQDPRTLGFTLVEFLVVFAILGGLVAMLLPATRSARPAAYRTQCKNHLKQCVLALHSYHDTHNAFPPLFTVDANGKPLHSWRTLLLPYMDQAALYKKIDLSKPWDDPANAEVRDIVIPYYSCPGHSKNIPRTHTTYLAVVTPESCLRPGEGRPISDVTDDRGATLMVIEAPMDRAVHWMSPTDADEALILSINNKSKLAHSGGMNVLYVDGSVKFLKSDSTESDRKARISVAGNDNVDP